MTGGVAHTRGGQEAFELVALAETMGVDTAWLGEGHFRPHRSVLSAPIGITGITAELNPGGFLPAEAGHRSLRLLSDKVMPACK